MSQHHDAAKWTSENKKIRARLAATLPAPCSICGFEVHEDQLWDADHLDGIQNTDEVGVAHRFCNRSHGGRQGAAVTNAKRKAEPRIAKW